MIIEKKNTSESIIYLNIYSMYIKIEIGDKNGKRMYIYKGTKTKK